tara:strand:+ start:1828 stop:2571 length:744 start_codon:yes stop_codon:yes gene_type:complete
MSDVIELLRNDQEYYGGVGKQYLSNSDIGTLLKTPEQFGVSRPDNKNFAEGRYFHQLILEPEKAENVVWVDCASRNTKAYKEFIADSDIEVALLRTEKETIEALVKKMLGNIDFFELIRAEGNIYEQPNVTEYTHESEMTQWKGKADIVGKDYVIDLKTTSNLDDFKWNARKYNYDSQAFIYRKLFGKPMMFLVIEKQSGRMGMFTGNQDFYDRGQDKMHKAIEVYHRFFGDNPELDIKNYYVEQEI